MALQVQKDDEVQILTSGGAVDPNMYRVDFTKKDVVGLVCDATGCPIKVHNSRIHKILKEENQMSDTATATIDTTAEGVSLEPAKTPRPRKVKTPPTPVDFDALVNAGFEVYNKFGMNLGKDAKVQGIDVAAHCVIGTFTNSNSENGPKPVTGIDIDAQFEGYEIFNTYNGTLGKKGKQAGRRFAFNEKMTREKKIKQLLKKEYVQHTVS
jgi:hypothetical protein